jgi:hypothetical protein
MNFSVTGQEIVKPILRGHLWDNAYEIFNDGTRKR